MANGIKRIYVHGGLAEVDPESVTILAERAFIADEADPRQLENDLAAAETALKAADSDAARLHVDRAIRELKALVASRHG